MKLLCPACRAVLCSHIGDLYIIEAGRGTVVAFEGKPLRWRCGKCRHEWIMSADAKAVSSAREEVKHES
jgi:ribosomal protein S27AE